MKVEMENRWASLMFVTACAGCSPPSPESKNLALKCQGREQLQITKDGIKQPPRAGSIATTFYRWNAETNSLVSENSGVEPTAFCIDAGQEKCSVKVTNGRLAASNLDMNPGKLPDSVLSFSEDIDIDLASLSGTSRIIQTTGILNDQIARVDFKAEVTRQLRCENER